VEDVLTRVMDDAAALAAAGRPVDAIDMLTDANRAEHNAAIEARLVALRHNGFWERDPATRPAPAPMPEMATLPRASDELPELAPANLTPSVVREHVRTHGCALVRGLVPPARAQELADGIDRALAAFDASVDGASVEDTAPWFVPFQPRPGSYRAVRRNWVRATGGMWTADSPRMLFELLDTVAATGLGTLLTEYLGERPVLAANKCTLRRVPLTRNGDWHQDGAFLGTDVRSLNLWLSLSHCGHDAPGLDIVPRHLDALAPTGTEGANFDWAVSPEVVAGVAAESPVVRPEFAPGDALLFDHMFLHRTAIDPGMTRERHAIESWFFSGAAYPPDQVPLLY
jgi:hypothetical protein